MSLAEPVPRAVEEAPRARRWPTVVALLVGTFLSSLDVTVVGTAMPRIVGELHGLSRYAWVFSAYLLASTVMVPIYGKLADLIGRRPTYFIGVAVFLAGSALCGASTSMEMLVAARTVQGLGAGAIFPLTMTIFGDLFSVEERSRVQGVFSLTWGVSSLVGPAVGGAFVAWWSWRWVFFINLPIGLAAVALLAISFRERAPRTRPRIDLAGAALLAGGIACLLGGLGEGTLGPRSLALGAVGALLLGALARVERRAPEPVVPPSLFADPVFTVGCAANLLFGTIVFAYIAYVPLHLQGVWGLSPLVAGLLCAPDTLTWTLAAFVAGRLILARGYRFVIRGGAAINLASTLFMWAATVAVEPMRALALYLVGLLLLGAGMGLTSTALVIAVQERVPWERRGAATAVLQLSRQVGATLGTTALGVLLVRLLAPRLAALPGAPPAETLVDPSRWIALPPSVLAPARAALGGSLASVALAVVGCALAASVAARLFPDVRARDEPATSSPP